MRKHLILTLAICLCVNLGWHCRSENFQDAEARFLEKRLFFFPDELPLSTADGKQRIETLSKLHLPSPSLLDSLQTWAQNSALEFKRFSAQNLPPAQQKHRAEYLSQIGKILKYTQEFKHNASFYNVGFGFEKIRTSKQIPAAEKWEILNKKLDLVPVFYEKAKANLNATAPKLADFTLEQHIKTLEIFRKIQADLQQKQSQLDNDMRKNLLQKIDTAILTIKDYIAFVESFKLQ
jgi:hypothetical protein